jgi:purine nucleosidase
VWVVTCDPGIDDAVAIVLASALPGFGPSAVVASAGNVRAGTGWRNAAGLTALLALDVPVGLGGDEALDGTPIGRGPSSHGADGLGGLALRLPIHQGAPVDGAPLVRGNVVATGPLTEVARAVRAGNPIDRVVWMGGSVSVAPGVAGVGAEFNGSADPLAVAEVLAAGPDVDVVPIEVTLQVVFGLDDLDPWRTGGPVARLCAELVERRIAAGPAARATPLHDPVAVLAAAEPALFRWQDHRVACRPDGSLVSDAAGAWARVAVAVDADAVRERVISGVADAAPSR